MKQLDEIFRAIGQRLIHGLFDQHRTHGNHPVGQPFGHSDDVRRDAETLRAKGRADPTEGGNHFIKYQHDAVLVAGLAQALKVTHRRHQNARRTGGRFNYYGGNIRGIVQSHQSFQIVGEMPTPGRLTFGKCHVGEAVGVTQMIDAGNHHGRKHFTICRHATD